MEANRAKLIELIYLNKHAWSIQDYEMAHHFILSHEGWHVSKADVKRIRKDGIDVWLKRLCYIHPKTKHSYFASGAIQVIINDLFGESNGS